MVFHRHLALQSVDVLPAIFGHLEQSDLARALRVCRLWNQWSDVLWSILPSLTPMLHLLFPFLFTDADDQYVRGVPLYQMDRQRLSKLNRTIRHLDASFSTSKSLFEGYNPDIPRLLLDLCELDTCLFPRLLSLNTECRSDAEVLGILPLLTPSLRSLHIVIHQSATDYMHELLEGVESNLPNLKRLSISYRQTPSSISGQHEAEDGLAHRETDPYLYLPIQSLCLPRSLRCLSVPSTCASADALFNFSCLPHLDSLEFTGSWESDVYEGEWSELPSSSFSALAQLSLPDCSTRIASTLLTIIPGTAPLSKVAITLSGTDSGLRELCAALARFCNTIRGISINGVCLHSNPVHLQEIAEALTSCSKLEKLALNMPIQMSDVELRDFTCRLPQTCVVHIGE
ncbi:hypothetical protein RHS04_06447 [Rhizoctonia solani]|uniref:F-box domain-containing protein n=1 Tax=Rhizoctonia solani TaxID=456999 RepID=A0A8H7H633_9AGAM|nr:hypothetical protein RHS04_06447 [Rhizoctonia solani]